MECYEFMGQTCLRWRFGRQARKAAPTHPYRGMFAKAKLNIRLMQRTPAKNTMRFHFFTGDIFPARNKIYPITRFSSPHITLIVGEDRPFPAGCAKGVGKAAPETP